MVGGFENCYAFAAVEAVECRPGKGKDCATGSRDSHDVCLFAVVERFCCRMYLHPTPLSILPVESTVRASKRKAVQESMEGSREEETDHEVKAL